MKNSILTLFLFIVFTSCEEKSNCDDLMCDIAIPYVTLNIVDSESGEDLFYNGTYTLNDVQLLNQNNESVPVRLTLQNKLESAIGDIEGNNQYRLLISPNLEILINTLVTRGDDPCCSSPNLVSFEVLNYEFEKNDEENYERNYTIFITN